MDQILDHGLYFLTVRLLGLGHDRGTLGVVYDELVRVLYPDRIIQSVVSHTLLRRES
jgi:hypothetical protein